MKQSRFDAGRLVQGVILFGFSVYLIKLLETGDIHRLVSPHIAVLLKITLGVLLVMTFYALATIFKKVETCEHDHHHDHHPRPRKGWVLLLAPIMLGLCVPTQSLGSSMLNNSLQVKKELAFLATRASVSSTSTQAASKDSVDLTNVPRQPLPDNKKPPKPSPGSVLSLLDLWNNLTLTPEYYYNQRFTYDGFVYHPPGWPTNRFVLTRYLITCCVADATPIGVTVESKDAAKYADDSWVQLTGPLSTRVISDASSTVPLSWYQGTDNQPTVLAQSIKPISEPKDPYLYLSTYKKPISGGK